MPQNDIIKTAIPVYRHVSNKCVDWCVAHQHQILGYQGV